MQLDGLNGVEIATVEAAEGGHGPIGAETSVGNAAACSRCGAIEATSEECEEFGICKSCLGDVAARARYVA